jgi:hypothetical protein
MAKAMSKSVGEIRTIATTNGAVVPYVAKITPEKAGVKTRPKLPAA